MSKGIMNRRDKMIWDNSALPTIDDVTGQIEDLAESVAGDLEDAYEELDDKIDQAIVDCTYTAGDNIEIDEDNVINCTLEAGNGIEIKNSKINAVETDYYSSFLYEKSYKMTNISTATSLNLNLTPKAVNVYLQSGYAKISGIYYPLPDSSVVTLAFDPGNNTCTVTPVNTIDELVFEIKYSVAETYMTIIAGTTSSGYWPGSSSPSYTMTFANDCYACSATGKVGGHYNSIFITLEQNVDIANRRNGGNYVTSTAFTYNDHTIYYVYTDESTWRNNVGIVETQVTNNLLANYPNVTAALQAFITAYFS